MKSEKVYVRFWENLVLQVLSRDPRKLYMCDLQIETYDVLLNYSKKES